MKSKRELLKVELINAISTLKRVADISKYFGCTEWKVRSEIKRYNLILPRIRTETEKARLARKVVGRMNTGENNPAKSLESRQKISQKKRLFWGSKSKEERSKLNTSHVTEYTKRICSENKKAWWDSRTDEQMERLSETFSKAQAKTIHKGRSDHQTGFYFSVKADSFYYRSSWELCVAERLDFSPIVASYSVESTTGEYYDFEENRIRWFRSDFIVEFASGICALLEVKPFGLLAHNHAKLIGQWEYSQQNGLLYKVITEDYIFDLDLFNGLLEQINDKKYESDSFVNCGIDGTRANVNRS